MKYLILGFVFLAASCGDDGRNGINGRDGCNTYTERGEGGIIIMCGNDQVGFISDSEDGVDGNDGIDGRNGIDGLAGVDGVDGIQGNNGIDGLNGEDGIDGVGDFIIIMSQICPDADSFSGGLQMALILIDGFYYYHYLGTSENIIPVPVPYSDGTLDKTRVKYASYLYKGSALFFIKDNKMYCFDSYNNVRSVYDLSIY